MKWAAVAASIHVHWRSTYCVLRLASGAEYAADLFSHSWRRVSGAEIKGGSGEGTFGLVSRKWLLTSERIRWGSLWDTISPEVD